MIIGDKDVLVVVDVQNDFISGSLGFLPGAEKVIPNINEIARLFEHIVIVADWHPPEHVSFASSHPGVGPWEPGVFWETIKDRNDEDMLVFPDHCVQGTWGAEIHADLELDRAELVFRKGYRKSTDSFGAFIENDRSTRTGLAEYMKARGFDRIFCCGCGRYGCVMETAIGASKDDFEVYMIDEATAGDDASLGEYAVVGNAAMKQAGVSWVSKESLTGASR